MTDMIDSGFLEEAWGRDHEQTQTIDCETYPASQEGQDDDGPVRRLQPFQSTGVQHTATDTTPYRRRLKAAGKAATAGAVAGGAVAAAAASEQDDRRLTLEQMIGTFAFHWGLMMIALGLSTTNALYKKYRQKGRQERKDVLRESNEPTAPSCTFYDDNPQKELHDLRQQMAGLQQHLLQFEKKMLEEQQCLGQQMQRLLEKASSNDAAHHLLGKASSDDKAQHGPALCSVTSSSGTTQRYISSLFAS